MESMEHGQNRANDITRDDTEKINDIEAKLNEREKELEEWKANLDVREDKLNKLENSEIDILVKNKPASYLKGKIEKKDDKYVVNIEGSNSNLKDAFSKDDSWQDENKTKQIEKGILLNEREKLNKRAASLNVLRGKLRKKSAELKQKEEEFQMRADYFDRKVSHIIRTENEMQKNLVGILSKSEYKSSHSTSRVSSGSNGISRIGSESDQFNSGSKLKGLDSQKRIKKSHARERPSSRSTKSMMNPPSLVDIPYQESSKDNFNDDVDDSSYGDILPPEFQNITFVGGRTSSYKPKRFSNKLGSTIRPAILNLHKTNNGMQQYKRTVEEERKERSM